MSSPFVTGGCFALKSKLHGKYLRYSPEKGKILEMSGEDALSPYTRFHAELSKEHDGHVHIRCCYNNKYWVAREVGNDEWCLMGDANEPQEDPSHPSCTLLRHEPSSVHADNVNLLHAKLKTSVYMLADAHPTEKSLGAGSLLLGDKHKLDEDAFNISVINLQGQLVLPKHVCFKGDNGMFLSVKRIENHNYLQFSSDDFADLAVRNFIHTNDNGTIRIYSDYCNMFWRRSPNWIWADSRDTTVRNLDTVFRALLLGDSGTTCALENLGNNYYCKRLNAEGKTSCLNAAVPSITREAQLELHEAVISRRIYGVVYRLDDVNIHDLKPRTYYNKTVVNNTDRPHKSKLTMSYSVTTSTAWTSSVSLKLGVATTITAGVPEIAQASIQISAEFSGSYTWGEAKSETEQHSNEEEVEVPAHTEVTVRVVATEGVCEIPFTYIQEDILTTGEKVVAKMDDGIFRGVNSYDFKTDITDKKI